MSQSKPQHSAAAPDNAEDQDRVYGLAEADHTARLADQGSAGGGIERVDSAGTDDALTDDQLDAVAGGAQQSTTQQRTAQQIQAVTAGGTSGGATQAPAHGLSIQSLLHLP